MAMVSLQQGKVGKTKEDTLENINAVLTFHEKVNTAIPHKLNNVRIISNFAFDIAGSSAYYIKKDLEGFQWLLLQ